MNGLQFLTDRRNIKKDSYRIGRQPSCKKDSTPTPYNVTPSQEGCFYLSRNRKVSCFGRSTVERLEGKPQAQGMALRSFPRLARCIPRVNFYPGGEHAKQGANGEGKLRAANGLGEKVQYRHPPRMTFATKPPPVRGDFNRQENTYQPLQSRKQNPRLSNIACARYGDTAAFS